MKIFWKLIVLLAFTFVGASLANFHTAHAKAEAIGDFCSNTDGFVWNEANPLPINSPCLNQGKWVAVGFWRNGTVPEIYETRRFDSYQELLAEAANYLGGTVWFERVYSIFVPLISQ